ncbi:phenylalanine--tRNA ligase subunit beta [Candidatus Woesearchaeota archaeon]|nr:phenylalanine--tRNA ligase subunit beta [Candidatus Woesearchaeota archaeon]
MPTVNLNRKEVEKLIGKKLDLAKLKDRISMLGTDLEDITEDKIIVEVFPNRPDMLSEQGFSRALSSFIGVKPGLRDYKVKKSNDKVVIESSVKEVRPFTACAIVKNLRFDEESIKSIIQIQEKLHIGFGRNRRKAAIGIYPLEKIKFPVRFIALPPEEIKFIPLESLEEMNGREILEKHPTGKEYAHLLNKQDKYPIFIDANNNVLSMPPIINSETVGRITDKTKEVFIECSGFDFNILNKCLNIIVTALADMNGEIYSLNLEYEKNTETTPSLTPEERELNLNYVNKMLGLNLKESEVKELLERMGHEYKNKKVRIPAYRSDILHEIDLIEDIAIAYGYENFKEEIPNVSTIGEESYLTKFKRRITEALIGLELIECSSFHLSNKTILNEKMKTKTKLTVVESAVNADYDTLRNFLLPNLLEILSRNKRYEYPQNIFEIGTVFDEDIKEHESLCIVKSEKEVNFTKIKQVLDALMSSLDIHYKIEEISYPWFIEGRAGEIIVNNKKIGMLGELNPEVLINWNLEMPASVLEFNINELVILQDNK